MKTRHTLLAILLAIPGCHANAQSDGSEWKLLLSGSLEGLAAAVAAQP